MTPIQNLTELNEILTRLMWEPTPSTEEADVPVAIISQLCSDEESTALPCFVLYLSEVDQFNPEIHSQVIASITNSSQKFLAQQELDYLFEHSDDVKRFLHLQSIIQDAEPLREY